MSELLEKILSDENIRMATKRVYVNKGAGGVDGVTVQVSSVKLHGGTFVTLSGGDISSK